MKRSVKVPKFSTWLREVMNCWREKNKALPGLDLLCLCSPLPKHLLLVTSEQDTRPDGFLVSFGSTF